VTPPVGAPEGHSRAAWTPGWASALVCPCFTPRPARAAVVAGLRPRTAAAPGREVCEPAGRECSYAWCGPRLRVGWQLVQRRFGGEPYPGGDGGGDGGSGARVDAASRPPAQYSSDAGGFSAQTLGPGRNGCGQPVETAPSVAPRPYSYRRDERDRVHGRRSTGEAMRTEVCGCRCRCWRGHATSAGAWPTAQPR